MTLLHPHPVPPGHHSTPTSGDSFVLLKHLEVQNKKLHETVPPYCGTRPKKKKLKKEINKGKRKEEVCGRVITTHPWCCVELQWCVFVRASLPPGVVGGRWCYRVPCLSEVIHVLANRSWWGCKGGEGGGRATAAHRRRGGEREGRWGGSLMAFQERRGEGC